MLIRIKDCGKGVNKDLLPSELAPGVCADAMNVEFADGFVGPRRGIQAAYTTPTATPYYLQTYITSTARFLVQAGTASVFVDDGSTRTDITGTPPTGGRDDRWTGCDLNGVLVLNNGVDDPSYWGGNTASNLATISGWTAGTKADSMRSFKNYLVAGAVTKSGTKYPYRVMWSNAAEPGAIPTAWTASSTNDAGEVELTGCGSYVDSLPLGDVNILYFQEGRYAQQYIGGNDVFRFTRLPGKDGLRIRGAVVQTPKGHVFMSNGDVMLHNGGDAVSIAQGKVRDWIFSSLDSANSIRSFLTLNPQRSEVWVVFPATGSTDCDTVAAWNWNTEAWAIHEISSLTYGTSGLVPSALSGGTWATDSNSWESDVTSWAQDEFSSNEARLILSTSTPTIGLANTGSTDFGASFTWFAEWRGIRPSGADQMVIPRASRWAFDGPSGSTASIYHGSAATADGEPTYSTASTHTQGTTNWVMKFASRGRYIAAKVSASSAQRLRLRSFELDLREGGRF